MTGDDATDVGGSAIISFCNNSTAMGLIEQQDCNNPVAGHIWDGGGCDDDDSADVAVVADDIVVFRGVVIIVV